MNDIKVLAGKIASISKEAQLYKRAKLDTLSKLRLLEASLTKKQISRKAFNDGVRRILNGKTKREFFTQYNDHLIKLLEEIREKNNKIINFITSEPIKKKELIAIDREALKEFVKSKKKTKKKKIRKQKGYTLYETSSLGKIANTFFEKITMKLTKKYPKYFRQLNESLRSSDLKILSKTYISIIFFVSACVAILTMLISLAFLSSNIFLYLLRTFFLTVFAFIISFAFVYFYPITVMGSRKRAIKNDLPFAIIHMAAVAGSGAQPISMFHLLLESKEYKGLEPEIRKIVNYTNLFGYDLSTSLRRVAITTPSKDFKELLNGLVSTIESGGSIRNYLDQKAKDALNNYRLDRKKYVEQIATYSDIYVGVLIAAPLLFFTSLAIIHVIGGTIGGLSISTLAIIGTYGAIPLLNILFLLVLSAIQPE